MNSTPEGSRTVGRINPQRSAMPVLGAGELGMAVLRGLARRSIVSPALRYTVLLRPEADRSADPRKQKELAELRSLGVNFVFSDLATKSESSLANIFGRFETVIGCTGFVAGRSIQLKLVRAVLAGGVERYVPWQFGVDYDAIGRGSAQDLFDEQLEVRDLLRSQPRTEWIIISTGMFTSFLFEPSLGVVDLPNNTVRGLGSWETAVTVTTPDDIGTLTAEILFAEPRIARQVVYTAGDTITYGQLADTLDLVLDRKMRRVVWSVAMLKDQLAQDPGNAIRKYRLVFAEGKGVAWAVGRTFNAERGMQLVGIERWARENLS